MIFVIESAKRVGFIYTPKTFSELSDKFATSLRIRTKKKQRGTGTLMRSAIVTEEAPVTVSEIFAKVDSASSLLTYINTYFIRPKRAFQNKDKINN